MEKAEIRQIIKQAKRHLSENWYTLRPHQRDDLKHKIKLLKKKIAV